METALNKASNTLTFTNTIIHLPDTQYDSSGTTLPMYYRFVVQSDYTYRNFLTVM